MEFEYNIHTLSGNTKLMSESLSLRCVQIDVKNLHNEMEVCKKFCSDQGILEVYTTLDRYMRQEKRHLFENEIGRLETYINVTSQIEFTKEELKSTGFDDRLLLLRENKMFVSILGNLRIAMQHHKDEKTKSACEHIQDGLKDILEYPFEVTSFQKQTVDLLCKIVKKGSTNDFLLGFFRGNERAFLSGVDDPLVREAYHEVYENLSNVKGLQVSVFLNESVSESA